MDYSKIWIIIQTTPEICLNQIKLGIGFCYVIKLEIGFCYVSLIY